MYKIKLENFEGPLDLLLYFIRRDELDIYDIPISKITKDFINVIEEWKRLNLVIAGDFIFMASTLMRVKVKMMIPRQEIDDYGETIDPRAELMQKLIDYKRFRDISDVLQSLIGDESHNIPRQTIYDITDMNDKMDIVMRDISLFDLGSVFKEIIDSRPVISQLELNREPIKLESQKELIINYFDDEGKLRFNSLIKKLETRMEIVVTFLALLDLVREGICTIIQSDIFKDIEIIHLKIKS